MILTLAPRGLQVILQKALQPKPEDRFHDMSELITEISDYIHSGSLQKDRQGIDYFFELFAQLEAQQKSLLTDLTSQNDPSIGITTSYGVGINALYFRTVQHLGEHLVVIAKGENRGVPGLVDTYRLHSLFDLIFSEHSSSCSSKLVPEIFQKALDQGVAFQHSFLTFVPSSSKFIWRNRGWGTLFVSSEDATREIGGGSAEKAVYEGVFGPKDRFIIIGCSSPTLLEFSSTPIAPLSVMLKEAIHSSRHLPCAKQTSIILQKLRLRGDCVVDDYPVCLIAINASKTV